MLCYLARFSMALTALERLASPCLIFISFSANYCSTSRIDLANLTPSFPFLLACSSIFFWSAVNYSLSLWSLAKSFSALFLSSFSFNSCCLVLKSCSNSCLSFLKVVRARCLFSSSFSILALVLASLSFLSARTFFSTFFYFLAFASSAEWCSSNIFYLASFNFSYFSVL